MPGQRATAPFRLLPVPPPQSSPTGLQSKSLSSPAEIQSPAPKQVPETSRQVISPIRPSRAFIRKMCCPVIVYCPGDRIQIVQQRSAALPATHVDLPLPPGGRMAHLAPRPSALTTTAKTCEASHHSNSPVSLILLHSSRNNSLPESRQIRSVT